MMGEVSKYWWIERKKVIILGEMNELVVERWVNEEIEWEGGGRRVWVNALMR